MKHLGLIKWFNIEKGYGIIETSENEEIFIHQNDITDKTLILVIDIPLIFEIAQIYNKKSAVNAQLPKTHNDFNLILSYSNDNNKNSISNTISTKHKIVFKTTDLIKKSIYHLLENKNESDIFNHFKLYFDSEYKNQGVEFLMKYIIFTQDILKDFEFELELDNLFKTVNRKNEQLINKLISYYLGINIKNQITDLDSNSNDTIEDILDSIKKISTQEIRNELNVLLCNKLLDLLITNNFDNKFNNKNTFNYFLGFLNNKRYNLDREIIISKLNQNIDNETKFIYWSNTKYFNPDKTFFQSNLNRLTYSQFLNAPADFHEEFFINHVKMIGELETIENFCILTFLITISPYKEAITLVYPKLKLIYKISYWLKFSERGFRVGNYSKSDIPFITTEFIDYIQNSDTLDELLSVYELTSKIIDSSTHKITQKIEFNLLQLNDNFNFSLNENIKVTSSTLISLFLQALRKCENNESVSLCKVFIPKFINEEILSLKELLNSIKNTLTDTQYYNEIFINITENIAEFKKVDLWFNGYIEKIDVNQIFEVFNNFEQNQQLNLLRKTFYLASKFETHENFLELLTTLSKKTNLNLEVKICLKIIYSLVYEKNYIDNNSISEVICQYLHENINELIKITNLFQECNGKSWATKGDKSTTNWFVNIQGKLFNVNYDTITVYGKDYLLDKERKTVEIEGENYSFKWEKIENNLFWQNYDKPLGITFCDAITPQYDEQLKHNYKWCCNSKCYSPNQSNHLSFDWINYSLRDFFKILNIPFHEEKYYKFVSLVNRANRLIDKLKCTNCNHILRDSKTSEFAFYQITTFHCTNNKCQEYHKIIYLNHCFNWRCLNVVDSRKSVTCPNGWYICDSCNSCCSQEKLNYRLNNLIQNKAFNSDNPRHQKLKYQVDNKLGHYDKEEKFNHLSGNPIKESDT